MNRYMIEGIVRDALGGKRVSVITSRVGEARAIVEALREHAQRVTPINGREAIDLPSGGWVRINKAVRGVTADVFVIGSDHRDNFDLLAAAVAITSANGGEVIRQ